MEILLAKSAGFCFGVKNAVKLLENELKAQAERGAGSLYTWGPIIHNRTVVSAYERRGVRVTEDAGLLTSSGRETVVIRAHGVAPEVTDALRAKNAVIWDGTCPFVARIHQIVREEAERGRHILIIGDARHPEVQGILGRCSRRATVISSREEALSFSLPKDTPISVVSQTTFPLEKFQEFVEIIGRKGYDSNVFSTVCHATQTRQEEARQLAFRADAMLVVGDATSANTRKLFEICKAQCRYTYHVQTASELRKTWFADIGLLGITAGASTPTNIIEEVLATCQKAAM